jgi:hypothetical protein
LEETWFLRGVQTNPINWKRPAFSAACKAAQSSLQR